MPRKLTKARSADRYDLYQRAVQSPDVDCRLFRRFYREHRAKEPLVLREDFCGAAAVCCEWTRTRSSQAAWGVDLDPEPLAWGREHNLSKLKPAQQKKVHLVEGDVRTTRTPPADIISAQNYSYCVFKTRDELRGYFKAARRHLAKDGVLLLDLFGGYEVVQVDRDERTNHGSFTYVWDQAEYDPINSHGRYYIHFRFRDGSQMRYAFRYDWRLWSIPEVRELLAEAGFRSSYIYWEDADEKGEGSGVYRRREKVDQEASWNVYIIGVK